MDDDQDPATSAAIDAVVFDMGGVLLDWDPRHLYRQLFTDEGAMERFLDELDLLAYHATNHDSGLRPMSDSMAELAARHPQYRDELIAWSERYAEMVGDPVPGSIELLAELRGRVPLYLLSNVPHETIAVLRRDWAFFDWFAGQVISAEEGLIKPEPRLFEVLVDRYGLTVERTAFIDDMPANVEAARAVGLHAIRFTTAVNLRADLGRLGVI